MSQTDTNTVFQGDRIGRVTSVDKARVFLVVAFCRMALDAQAAKLSVLGGTAYIQGMTQATADQPLCT